MGNRWRHSFDAGASLSATEGVVAIARTDGGVERFTQGSGSQWIAAPDVNASLQQEGSDWVYTSPARTVERFNLDGKLISRKAADGFALSFEYNPQGKLSKVSNTYGLALLLTYNAFGLLDTVTLPGGGSAMQYQYVGNGDLERVIYADGTTRQYRYQTKMVAGIPQPTLLSELIDEQGASYGTWSYDDTTGLATTSQHAGGVDLHRVTYQQTNGVITKATVINPLQLSSEYGFSSILGVSQPVSETRSSDNASRGQVFDTNGNIKTRTDFNGVTTSYIYDLTRNLPTGVTVALGTPQVRTVTTTWHPTFRLPVTITEPGRVTTFTYDNTKGLLTQKQVTADGVSRSESWSYFPNGLLQTATDARGKVTSYTYDAQGNLATVTDPVGLVTQFTSYDPHGNVLTQIAPNGVTTTFTYDLRQRLKTRTTGGELTQFAYKPTGLLEKVTFPDQSWLQYRYDPAHRLIGIDHSNGSRIDYTLDNAGNTKREDRYDPAGVLAAAQQAATQAQSLTTAPKAQ